MLRTISSAHVAIPIAVGVSLFASIVGLHLCGTTPLGLILLFPDERDPTDAECEAVEGKKSTAEGIIASQLHMLLRDMDAYRREVQSAAIDPAANAPSAATSAAAPRVAAAPAVVARVVAAPDTAVRRSGTESACNSPHPTGA